MAKLNGKRLVVKSNEFALSQFNMTTTAQKIVNLAISEIPKERISAETTDLDKQIKVRLTGSDIKRYLEWEGHSIYDMLDQVGAELQNVKIVIDDTTETGEHRRIRVNPFSRTEYTNGYIDVCFEPYMNQHLIKKANTTRYFLEEIRKFNRKYTLRLYEVCQSILYKGSAGQEFSFEELRGIVGARMMVQDEKTETEIIKDTYPSYAEFKRNVLVPAQKEMDKTGRISFDFKEIRKGKSVEKVWLCAYEKDKTEVTAPEPAVVNNDNIPEGGINDMLFYIDECKAFLPTEIRSSDVLKILTTANYDVNLIREKYEMAQSQGNINNLVGWLIAAIENDYENVPVQKKNSFNNFEGRVNDYDRLEKMLANGRNS